MVQYRHLSPAHILLGNGMAVNFAETWQSCAFQLPDYTKGETYSHLLSLFMDNDRYHIAFIEFEACPTSL